MPHQANFAPLVTIVVINYNYGRYLRQCLQSVFAQTYLNIECIVIDNKSTDNSLDVISAFESEIMEQLTPSRSLQTRIMPSNLHLMRACIEGFEISKGEFVIYLDADDILLPANVEAHVAAHMMVRIPVGVTCVDMCQSTATGIVSSTGRSLSNYVLSGRGRAREFTRDISRPEADFVFGAGWVPAITTSQLHFVEKETSSEWVWSATSALCFRRTALVFMFAYKPGLQASADAYLVRGIGSLTGSVLIDTPLAVYRHHSGNIFARNPPLEAFRSHDAEQLEAEDLDVAEAVIACFVHNVDLLARTLEYSGYFIKAVEILAKSGMNSLLRRRPSYMREFISEHRSTLDHAFGANTVAEWCRWYGGRTNSRGSIPRRIGRFVGLTR